MKEKNKENKIKNIFEAGKISVHCKICKTNYKTNDYPDECLFCKSKKLVFNLPEKEEKKQVHVIIGVYSGIVEDCGVFVSDKEATEYEKEICEKYEIPFNNKKRENYYESNGEHEIKHLKTEVR